MNNKYKHKTMQLDPNKNPGTAKTDTSQTQEESGYPNELQPPMLPPEAADPEKPVEPTGENLKYNEQAGSYELDAETEDSDYQHPDPYPTSAPGGRDAMSTYDEANPFTQDAYPDPQVDPSSLDDLVDASTEREIEALELLDDEWVDPEPLDERDPLGDKQIQKDDPTE
jgi:hypothetical protein